jgi:cytochrome P450
MTTQHSSLSSVAEVDNALASHELHSQPKQLAQVFKALRRTDPVHWTTPEGHPAFWAITKHADIMEIGRNGNIFLAGKKSFMRNDEEESLARRETGGSGQYMRTILNMDGEDHKTYRGLTQAFFLPANLKRLDGLIAERSASLVQKMIDLGRECDFCNDIAVWYPLQIIMSLLGVPDRDHPKLLRLTQQFLAPKDPTLQRSNTVGGDKRAIIEEHFAYFRGLLNEKRTNPADDLGSLIANSKVDGALIPELEALSYYVVLANAGHDPTSSSMGTGLYCLLKNPSELEKLRCDPELMRSAIEEMFRFATPAKHFIRTATADYELRERKIKSGQEIALFYQSGNFDEEVFEDPESFRVDRKPNRQISFGSGLHACLGQNLARLTMKAFFTEMLRRLHHIELAGEPEYIVSNQIAGLKKLPIRYSPAA